MYCHFRPRSPLWGYHVIMRVIECKSLLISHKSSFWQVSVKPLLLQIADTFQVKKLPDRLEKFPNMPTMDVQPSEPQNKMFPAFLNARKHEIRPIRATPKTTHVNLDEHFLRENKLVLPQGAPRHVNNHQGSLETPSGPASPGVPERSREWSLPPDYDTLSMEFVVFSEQFCRPIR